MVLVIVRASDGASFHLYKKDLINITTLDEFKYNIVSPLLEIPPDYLICMNEEGAQLKDESIQHLALLAGSPSNSLIHSTSKESNLLTSAKGKGKEREKDTNPHTSILHHPSSSSSFSVHSTAGRPHAGVAATSGVGPLDRSREKRVYVFDREHLDADPDLVSNQLNIDEVQVLVEAPLEPQDPLHSHIGLSLHHLDTLHSLITAISLQHASIQLALSNLDRVNKGTSSSLGLFLESTSPSLNGWQSLLDDWEDSMKAISKVSVAPALLLSGSRGQASSTLTTIGAAAGAGVKERFLGDYVSREKMTAVKDGCFKVFNDLNSRTDSLRATVDQVLKETGLIQEEFDATSRDMEDLEACAHDAESGHQRIEELVRASEDMRDPDLLAQCFHELTQLDVEHRDRIRFLIQHKNAMTRYVVTMLQRISGLQSDIASIPSVLAALDHDARTKTDNFKHLARLQGLIPAYVATIVEVVRRRHYSKLLKEHSNTLGTTLEHLLLTEKEKRIVYRNRFSGKLPWEVKGLGLPSDESIPFVDFNVQMAGDDLLPDLEKENLEQIRSNLVGLEDTLEVNTSKNPIREARLLMDELIQDIDQIEIEFNKVALDPQQIAVAASMSKSGKLQEIEALEEKIRSLEEAKQAIEREMRDVRSGHEDEIAQLNHLLSRATTARETDQTHLVDLREELMHEREARNRQMAQFEKQERETRRAQEEADRRVEEETRNFKTKEEELQMLFNATKKSEEEFRAKVADLDRKHVTLVSHHEGVRGELARAQTAIDELEAAVRVAERGTRDLTVIIAEKERLLRDQRGEAELDRAVLEKEVSDLRATIERHEEERDRSSEKQKGLEEALGGLKEQVAQSQAISSARQNDLEKLKQDLETHRQEKERSLSEINRDLSRTTSSARSAVRLAGKLRDENEKITALLKATTQPRVESSSENVGPSSATPGERSSGLDLAANKEAVDYESGKLEDLISDLSKYETDDLVDAVRTKIDSLSTATRKWIKEAKAYRERAHRAQIAATDKIAFRNFAKGDLALFLPTRNTEVPVWAAFNVSFPHHFLSATGVVAEQVKTREWIVARITNLTEKVVDAKDKDSNPYILPAGTKFFLLEVEPWSSKDHSGNRARKHSSAEKGTRERRSSSATKPKANDASILETPNRAGESSSVLVASPSTSKRPSSARRSVSEGATSSSSLPPNATSLARSEYAIIEEEEINGAPSNPSSPAMRFRQPNPSTTQESSPILQSGIGATLARSQPSSPTRVRQDPSDAANPFALSASPPIRDARAQTDQTNVMGNPAATNFEGAVIEVAGDAPAFLPSSGRKTPSTSGGSSRGGSQKGSSVTASTPITMKLSPRYVRTSASGGVARPTTMLGTGTPSNVSTSNATSPASTSGYGATPGAFPRSASSGSSILSASVHRRNPSSPLDKALPTTGVMSTSSKWTSMTQSYAEVEGESSTNASGLPSAQIDSKKPTLNSTPSEPSGLSRTRKQSLTSTSVLESLVGRSPPESSPSTGTPPSGSGFRSKKAEGEVRKLLSPK